MMALLLRLDSCGADQAMVSMFLPQHFGISPFFFTFRSLLQTEQ